MSRDADITVQAWTNHVAWVLVLPLLLAWQVWMILGLFACRDEPGRLLDDRPLLSGRHPLHQYHGLLGARSLLRRGSLSCYDPAFHAGYPKTPVFDGGSRPAELALAAAGGEWRPAVYKITLAAVVSLVPLLLWLTGRAVGLPRGGAALTALLGLLVWRSRPCRDAFEAGEVDLLFAALFVVLQSGLLIRYHRQADPLALLGLVVVGFLAWLAQPLLAAALLPLFLVYYVRVGARHGLAWHTALLGGLGAAIVLNLFWLLDWFQLAWIREPLRGDLSPEPGRGLRNLWLTPSWGGLADRVLAILILLLALVGAYRLNRQGRRETARLFGLAALGLLTVAGAGALWDTAGRYGVVRLALPALLFAAPLAAQPVSDVLAWLGGRTGGCVLLLGVTGLAAPAWLSPEQRGDWAERIREPRPLHVGFDQRQVALAARLREHTTPEARILWEDRRLDRLASHWSPLLPLLTERHFIGGLDAEAGIEHTSCGLVDRTLAGRPIDDWTDERLLDYCERYNVGWVVCRTPATTARFARWPGAERKAELDDGVVLFTVRRRPTFTLSGQAQWLQADAERIVLAQVTPKQGKVVLSLHYQPGLRASPSRVRIEPEYDPRDPTPFVRLVVEEPVALVTLTWDRR
jgi:hypothetical protein